ncbi:MAG: ABC transporter ATP-binding protein [Euryarchaeota archaeon RBG_13_61_15]|nr:MAG: ABC transporter ATP-binding protein [Euryarchaeota archaeon RBG_13_61_15]
MTGRGTAGGVANESKRLCADDATIRIEKLRKVFGDLVAVAGLDLRVGKGVLYGMIGPNGSGKTTTIRMLVGLARPTGGKAWVLGEEVPMRRGVERIGYMPQEMAIYTDLTVHENLELFSQLYSMGDAAFREREKELLGMIDLGDRRDSLVSQLSGGMRHRVSLACALVHDPEVVFLDEPTVGVDPELRAGFWRYFADLKERGKTIVLTTHYMDEATRCDIVGMMRLGELIAEGTPAQLMDGASAGNLEDAFMQYARRSGE